MYSFVLGVISSNVTQISSKDRKKFVYRNKLGFCWPVKVCGSEKTAEFIFTRSQLPFRPFTKSLAHKNSRSHQITFPATFSPNYEMNVTIAIESKHRKKEMPLSQTSNYAKVFAEKYRNFNFDLFITLGFIPVNM